MKKFTLIVLFITWQISLAKSIEILNQDTINFVDAEGRKQGKWVIFNKVKKLPNYPENAKVEEGKYLDNKRTGPWKEFYPNGIVKSKINFVNNRPDGYYISYHENGKIFEEGMWKNNRWVGSYKLYYDNGQMQYEHNYNPAGKREGVQKYYHENGQLMIEGTWTGGKEAGVQKEYYENGDLKSEKNFNDGNIDIAATKTYEPKKPLVVASAEKPVKAEPKIEVKADEKPNLPAAANVDLKTITGHYVLYNKNKQLAKEGDFERGKLINGKVYHYNENGILTRIAVYKEGRYVGDTVIED